MKKLLKILGVFVMLIVVVLLAGLAYINFKGIPSYAVEKVDYQAVITPQSIERGKKLTMMLCAGCHKNYNTGRLSGTRMLDAPAEFGVIYSANITNHKKYGIGDWTDGELLYLLRTGIKKDGKYSPPYMAKLPKMADDDINAIISFLRSDDPMVAADPTPTKPCEPSFLTKLLCNVAFKPLPMPNGKIEMPDTNNTLEWGKYLAHNLDCFSCHSADFKSVDFLNPEKSEGYFGGGNKPLNREGEVMLTPNLTPDKETGIGNWSEEKFLKVVKYGVKEGVEAMRYPMMPYVHLTDQEVSAIYAYLQSIPPIKNKVVRSGLEMTASK
ncbi:MAG: cytochrome c [Chitinophagales bacterium]